MGKEYRSSRFVSPIEGAGFEAVERDTTYNRVENVAA
jgi:hypothetical protein